MFVSLILPVLIPSWRFFDGVRPSPRVQWARVGDREWRALRPRPDRVTPWQVLLRLFWNPEWNESLFLVSCAERIQAAPTPHAVQEIKRRVRQEVGGENAGKALRFRLVFVRREGEALSQEVVYTSVPFRAEVA